MFAAPDRLVFAAIDDTGGTDWSLSLSICLARFALLFVLSAAPAVRVMGELPLFRRFEMMLASTDSDSVHVVVAFARLAAAVKALLATSAAIAFSRAISATGFLLFLAIDLSG